jgi:hypothetical protein
MCNTDHSNRPEPCSAFQAGLIRVHAAILTGDWHEVITRAVPVWSAASAADRARLEAILGPGIGYAADNPHVIDEHLGFLRALAERAMVLDAGDLDTHDTITRALLTCQDPWEADTFRAILRAEQDGHATA